MALAPQLLDGLQKSLAAILKQKRAGSTTRKRVLSAASEYINRMDAELGDDLDMAELVEKVKGVANKAADAARAGKQDEVDVILRELVPAKKTKQALTPERLERKQAKAKERNSLLQERDEDGVEKLSDESMRRIMGDDFEEKMGAIRAAADDPEEQARLLRPYQDEFWRGKVKRGEASPRSLAELEISRGRRQAQDAAAAAKKKKGKKGKKGKKSTAAKKTTEEVKPLSKKVEGAVAESKKSVAKTTKAAETSAKKEKAAKAKQREKTAPKRGADKEAAREANRRAWYEKNADKYDETRQRQGKPKLTAEERRAYIDRLAKQAEEARKRRGE